MSANRCLPSSFRIGTRKSPLALAQARETQEKLREAHPGLAAELAPMTTGGDRNLSTPLAETGGKALFTRELEDALLAGHIALAVHSAKDMQAHSPEGLMLAAVLPREDARDVLIAGDGILHLAQLPDGARLGTSSLRRAAQALHARPDLRIVPLRGNVQTRLEKLARGEADATLLALAGLKRLGIAKGVPLSCEEMLPAPAQGAIALQCRAQDAATRALLAPLNDADTMDTVLAERALLAELDGSCRTPIAAYAEILGTRIRLRAMLLTPDGRCRSTVEESAERTEAVALGVRAAVTLREAL